MAVQLPPLTSVTCTTRGISRDGLRTRDGLRSRGGVRSSVLSGLRLLQGGSTTHHPAREHVPCSRGILLHPITAVSKRANECVAHVDADFLAAAEAGIESTPKRKTRCTVRNNAHVHSEDVFCLDGVDRAAASFESLVSQIDEQLHGGDSTVRVVRKGESILERVPVRGIRRYKIPLPSRPTEVTVSLHRASGRAPSLVGSTSDPQPSSNKYDFRGKDDKIVYKHVLPPGDEDAGIDRRHVAPSCRELFVTVEATIGECEYEISVKFAAAKVALSRKEMAAQIAKVHRAWEARIHELQHDTVAREEFDCHVMDLRESIAQQKSDAAHGANYVRRNKSKAREQTQTSRVVGVHKRALQKCARHEACSLRRAGMDPQQYIPSTCVTPFVATEPALSPTCVE